jgi:hypothetical protein
MRSGRAGASSSSGRPWPGSLRNTERLRDCGLAAGPEGVACDVGCRVFDMYGIVTDDIFAAGDVARSPHPVFGREFLALEHWSNAVEQAQVAAHNMLSSELERRPYLHVPTFWSFQFGVGIKPVGVPSYGEEVIIMQGIHRRAPLRRPLRPRGPDRCRGHVRPEQVARLLPGTDRDGRPFPRLHRHGGYMSRW